MSDITYQTTFVIAEDHPALPGHFPGQPVVPGVVILDQVAAALERWRGDSVAALAQVKFLRPLLPQQVAELHLEEVTRGFRFSVLHAGAQIANGQIETRGIRAGGEENP